MQQENFDIDLYHEIIIILDVAIVSFFFFKITYILELCTEIFRAKMI